MKKINLMSAIIEQDIRRTFDSLDEGAKKRVRDSVLPRKRKQQQSVLGSKDGGAQIQPTELPHSRFLPGKETYCVRRPKNGN